MKQRLLLRNSLLIFTLITSFNLLQAQSAKWTGDGNGTAWDDASNWAFADGGSLMNTATVYTISAATPNGPKTASGASISMKQLDIEDGVSVTVPVGFTINVTGGDVNGINLYGSLTNIGTINVDNVQNHGINMIANSGGVLTNGQNGQINITNTVRAGIYAYRGDINNYGAMNVGASGSIGEDGIYVNFVTFNNAGQIFANNCGESGLQTDDSSTLFTNTGTITVGNLGLVGEDCIYVRDGHFQNDAGSINLDNSTEDGLHTQSGTFTNNATINVGLGLGNLASDGVHIRDPFINNGIITVKATVEDGLHIRDDFTNNGTITVFNQGENGLHIRDRVDNYGNITVINSTEYGIFNRSTFNNHASGQVTIQGAEEGIHVQVGSVNNYGNIQIGGEGNNDILVYGINNRSSLNNYAGGEITVNNASLLGLRNVNNYYNEACAKTTLFAPFDNTLVDYSTITNDGLFKVDASAVSKTGIFTNNGVLEDVQGSITTDGDFVNNEIFIKPLLTDNNGLPVQAFDLGANNALNIVGVFTDPTVNSPDPAYNGGNNTYTYDGGPTDLYVEIEDLINNCEFIVEWKILSSTTSDWLDNGGIGCSDGNTSSYDANTDTHTITAYNCTPNYPYLEDQMAFVFQDLCGDGEIIAEVTDVDGSGFAGIMMRNSEDANAQMVSVGTNMVSSIRRQVRLLTGAPAWPQTFYIPNRYWLRISRQGNLFRGYVSTDGNNWLLLINQTVTMSNDCIQVGMYAYSDLAGIPLTATFSNVSINEANNNLAEIIPTNNVLTNPEQTAEVSIFPNPTSDFVNVKFDQLTTENTMIQLFDATGKLVMSNRIEVDTEATQLDVKNLVSGMYQLVITNDQGRMNQSLVINR